VMENNESAEQKEGVNRSKEKRTAEDELED
jgi:hypothetical protein